MTSSTLVALKVAPHVMPGLQFHTEVGGIEKPEIGKCNHHDD